MDASMREDLERLYRGMTPEQVAAHEDWVRRFKAEKAEEDAKAKAALKAKLLKMSDKQAVFYALQAGIEGSCDDYLPSCALEVLTDAGFVRGAALEAAYRAGFKQSGEGWNGEHRPEAVDDEHFIEQMHTDLADLRAA